MSVLRAFRLTLGAALDELADTLCELADRAEDLRPPTEVDDVHVRLVAGLKESADELRQLAEVYGDSETSDPMDAIVKLSEVQESKTLEEAARELERRGYDMPAFLGGS